MIDEKMINNEFKPKNPVEACWEFCRALRPGLPEKPYLGMKRIPQPEVNCVVLAQIGTEWHAGIVWPDCLHVIHAEPQKDGMFIVRNSRLTAWPWKKIVEGYYVPLP
jgi:hypothetical protein